MSRGLSPKLPLTKDPQDGYKLNKSYVEMIKQNIKMLVLTAPGERIMDPEFGVGLRNYLFRNNIPELQGEIRAKIAQQVNRYMPFIQIEEIRFTSPDESSISENGLYMMMSYKIIPLDLVSSVEINAVAN